MNIKKIIKNLEADRVVALETETVIGLFTLPKNELGIQMNKMKNRKENSPIQVMVADIKQLEEIAKLSHFQRSILERELPSSRSFIVPGKKSTVFENRVGNKRTLLIRMPSQADAPQLVKLLKETGPLFATSANLHDEKPFKSVKKVEVEFNVFSFSEGIKQTSPSKIYSLVGNKIKQIRG